MKPATVKQLKDELKTKSQGELVELCLRLSKFKKENKELLTYLLYDADDENGYIRSVKEEVDLQFEEINRKSIYWVKKSVRKILRSVKKYIRYSGHKQTEVELLIYFCETMREMKPSMHNNTVLIGIYQRQIELIKKSVNALHEDLRHDYDAEIAELEN